MRRQLSYVPLRVMSRPLQTERPTHFRRFWRYEREAIEIPARHEAYLRIAQAVGTVSSGISMRSEQQVRAAA